MYIYIYIYIYIYLYINTYKNAYFLASAHRKYVYIYVCVYVSYFFIGWALNPQLPYPFQLSPGSHGFRQRFERHVQARHVASRLGALRGSAGAVASKECDLAHIEV